MPGHIFTIWDSKWMPGHIVAIWESRRMPGHIFAIWESKCMPGHIFTIWESKGMPGIDLFANGKVLWVLFQSVEWYVWKHADFCFDMFTQNSGLFSIHLDMFTQCSNSNNPVVMSQSLRSFHPLTPKYIHSQNTSTKQQNYVSDIFILNRHNTGSIWKHDNSSKGALTFHFIHMLDVNNTKKENMAGIYKRQELLHQHLSSLLCFVGFRVVHLFSFLCCVFCSVCLRPASSVPNECYQYLWIVQSWFAFRFSLTFVI